MHVQERDTQTNYTLLAVIPLMEPARRTIFANVALMQLPVRTTEVGVPVRPMA